MTQPASLDHVVRYVRQSPDVAPEQLVGPAAVLLLVTGVPPNLHVLLIQRAAHLRHHSGQMALPGGGYEPEDRTLWQTAVREAREEVGLDPGAVRRMGSLTPIVIGVSGYTVVPWVGVATARPAVHPDPREVAALHWVTVMDLAQSAQTVARTRSSGQDGRWPEFHLAAGRVWGATAFMLDEFLHAWSGGRPEAWRYRALMRANVSCLGSIAPPPEAGPPAPC